MVAILRPYGEIISKPFEVKHTVSGIRSLIGHIQSIDGESRIVMEHMGRYYEPLVCEFSQTGLFVSAVNPKLIKYFGDNSLRKVKSDNADALKIARYTLDSPVREDGSQKWINFIAAYWHVDSVRKRSQGAFIEHYQKWCKHRKYNFSRSKAVEIYETSKELVSVLPKHDLTKVIIKQVVEQLNTASQMMEQLRAMMNEADSKLPEYPVVMDMKDQL